MPLEDTPIEDIVSSRRNTSGALGEQGYQEMESKMIALKQTGSFCKVLGSSLPKG